MLVHGIPDRSAGSSAGGPFLRDSAV